MVDLSTEEELQRPHIGLLLQPIPLACKWLLMRSTGKEWEQCVRAFDSAGESASVILVVGVDPLFFKSSAITALGIDLISLLNWRQFRGWPAR